LGLKIFDQLIKFGQISENLVKIQNVLFTNFLAIILMAVQFGRIAPLDEQYRILLNPNRAKYNRPVLASASENQPSAWSALFFDSHFGILFMPVGLYLILKQTSESTILLVVYAVIRFLCNKNIQAIFVCSYRQLPLLFIPVF